MAEQVLKKRKKQGRARDGGGDGDGDPWAGSRCSLREGEEEQDHSLPLSLFSTHHPRGFEPKNWIISEGEMIS
jgi:hypothetical protein